MARNREISDPSQVRPISIKLCRAQQYSLMAEQGIRFAFFAVAGLLALKGVFSHNGPSR